ncbi:MAG: hypothetical protein AAGG99_04965 [Pseudomonadota bacterium]
MDDAFTIVTEYRLVFEIVAFGTVMFALGWFVAQQFARIRVRAGRDVMVTREHAWRRRHAQLKREAGDANDRATRDRRRHRVALRKIQDAS